MPENPNRTLSPALEVDPHLPLPADERQPEPVVIVVPYRPHRSWFRYLPPLFILSLGMLVLSYRAFESDWNGIRSKLAALLVKPPALEKAKDPVELAANPLPDTVAPAPTLGPVAPVAEPPLSKKAAEDEAEKEALAKQKQLEELQRFKEEAARKQDATEEQRRREAARDRFQPRFGMGGPGPNGRDLHEAMRRQMEAMMAQQQAMMEDFHRRNMQEFQDFQRRFAPGPGLGEWPPRGFGMAPNPGMNAPESLDPGAAQPGEEDREVRTPDGGVGRFRRFVTPDGRISRFEWRWQSSSQPTPPPPVPGRPFD